MASPPPSFSVAYYGCLRGDRLGETLALSPDHRTLTYGVEWWYEVSRRNPEGDLFGTRGPLLDCVLLALGAPPGERARIDATSASAGTVSDAWPGVRVTWSNDPDAGISAVFSAD
jgi:hypothetical protein